MRQGPDTIDYYLGRAPKGYTIEQKLKYAELCTKDYHSVVTTEANEAVARDTALTLSHIALREERERMEIG